jgi:uncharacterized protein with GYD domain
MPKFMIRASYTLDGLKGLLSGGGSARRSAVEEMVSGLGGSVESFHFGFGEDDVYVIAELPDNVTAAAISLTVNATGGVEATTVPLLTPEEVDQAAEKSVDYRPPGA